MTRTLPLLFALALYALSLVSHVKAHAFPANGALISRDSAGSDGDDPAAQDPSSSKSSSTSSSSSPSDSSSSKNGSVGEGIIDFLQVMFEGGIKSQQCWVTLVNATQSDLGSCLGLSTFSTLVVQGTEGSFATGVDAYLTDLCGGTKCTAETLKYWKGRIQQDCGGDDAEQPLLKTLNVVLNNYESSLYDLACKVHFNGTSAYCLSDVLNSTQTTNSKDFFTNILTGTNVNWYDQSFFYSQPICTGCMHEVYKAAMFLIPSIRSWNEMIGLGGSLSTCPSGDNIEWKDICDQQKPASLSVEAVAAYSASALSDMIRNPRTVLFAALAVTVFNLIL